MGGAAGRRSVPDATAVNNFAAAKSFTIRVIGFPAPAGQVC
jgi:hypothetical protein